MAAVILLLCCSIATITAASSNPPIVAYQMNSCNSSATGDGNCVTEYFYDVITGYLANASGLKFSIYNCSTNIDPKDLPPNSIIISIGCQTANQVISNSELASVGSEGYVLRWFYRFVNTSASQGVFGVAIRGNPKSPDAYIRYNNLGLAYGSFDLLQQFNFSFLHPLKPIIPQNNSITSPPNQILKLLNNETSQPNTNQTIIIETINQSPHFGTRIWHYHTEHPLELMEFFNGFPSNDSSWEDMIPECDLFFQWIIANKQNALEFVLLWAVEWEEFANSTERLSRLNQITQLGHQYGIAMGADIPIAEKQQHAWYMTDGRGTIEEQTANIALHLSYVFDNGFDFLSTESGYSEFTHPNCTLMLEWMNITTSIVMNNYTNKRAFIKCHCSQGQICKEYDNPLTGEPINFNFLPIYADPALGVMAHTVQFYNYTEPAPTYGNTNFTYMSEFLLDVAIQGEREVLYFGETAYWVNYDIDVPLFLPVYALSRMDDIRYLVNQQKLNPKVNITGTANFESGWEWGYWLQNVITARLAYDPLTRISDRFDAYAAALEPCVSIFGNYAEDIKQIIIDVTKLEIQFLIYGNYNGTYPSSVIKRNGIAYLEGWDTWSELSVLVEPKDATQPVRLSLNEVRLHLDGKKGLPSYKGEIQPLLRAMASNFSTYAQELRSYRDKVPQPSLYLFDSILDSLNITAIRANEVYALYDYVSGFLDETKSWREKRLAVAQQSISQAQEVVKKREQEYAVPWERIAGWGANPTSYHYGYLWTVHSLYYYWRDYSKATNTSISVLTPCFMNIIDGINISFGDGKLDQIEKNIGNFLDEHGLAVIGECLLIPSTEPVYPWTPYVPINSTNMAPIYLEEQRFYEFFKNNNIPQQQ